jgi:hypothetical protein
VSGAISGSQPGAALKLLLDVGLQQAAKDGDPSELLAALRFALKHDPENIELAKAVEVLAAELADSPAVVLIERVRVAGRATSNPEGNVYIEEPDGRLRPASGADLARANERFPEFLRNWTIDEG